MANATVLPDDYDGLKKEYLLLRKELDCVNQELYGCKRHLRVLEALQVEYQSEIELLQSKETDLKLKHDEKLAQLEEDIAHIKIKYNEQLRSLETELISKDEEIVTLKSEVELLKISNAPESTEDDLYKLLEEVKELQQRNLVLLENEKTLKSSLEVLQKRCYTLEENLNECKDEAACLRESLTCKRDELVEANDLAHKLNDEILCLKAELESFKSKPLDDEIRGNSLFAEVDDRRVYLQKTIDNMKTEYIAMKQERAKHLQTISQLKRENRTLCDQWKKDVEEKEDDQCMVTKAYKDQIQILENLVTQYQSDLAAKPLVISTGTFNEIEYCQVMLKNKSKELEQVREQLNQRGLTHVLLSTSLKKANEETRKWRWEATKKQCELELEPGTTLPEGFMSKKLDEEMAERIKPKQMRKGPLFACKEEAPSSNTSEHEARGSKEVIMISDSSEDESHEEKPLGILKDCKENIVKVTDDEKSVEVDVVKVESCEEKENVFENVSRRVTFAQSTVSPKATDRTALRKNCKRVVSLNTIYMPSE